MIAVRSFPYVYLSVEALARQLRFCAVVMCAAGVPLLPTNDMKIVGTFFVGCVFLVGMYLREDRPFRRTPLDIPIVAFGAAAVCSTIFGVNPHLSLDPTSERGEGLLDYFVYLPLALMAARLTRFEVRRFLGVLVSAGSIVAVLAILQYYGHDVTPWIGSRGLNYGYRAWGTLANPDFLGGYCVLLLPIAAVLTIHVSRWYLVPTGLLCGALLASATRSAWVGAILAGAILYWRSDWWKPTITKRLCVVLVVCIASVFVMVKTQPHVMMGARAVSTFSAPSDSSMRSKLWIWVHVLPMIAKRPVFGWGFSSIAGHLPGMGSASYHEYFPGNPVIDIAHNDVLQVAETMGLLGLAAYAWVWITALGRAHRSVHPLALGIFASLIGYAVWVQTTWGHIGTLNVLWMFFGVAVSLRR